MTEDKNVPVCEMLFIDDHHLNSRIVVMPANTRIKIEKPQTVLIAEKAIISIVDSEEKTLHQESHDTIASAKTYRLRLTDYMRVENFTPSEDKNIVMQEVVITKR